MAERLVDVRVPPHLSDDVRKMIEELDPQSYEQRIGDDSIVFRFVAAAEKVEPFLDALTDRTGTEDGVRAIVLAVAALSPRDEAAEALREDKDEDDDAAKDRVSRDELLASLKGGAMITPTFLSMTVLSVVVAGVGLATNSPAVVIGAMVIAPLLAPNMALALATTLADGALAARAVRANVAGVMVAVLTAFAAGLLWRLDPSASEISGRTTVSLSEIALALASGAAGAIAVTQGAASSLVGVMVAVSLLPPLVASGMLFVQGHSVEAGRAALLVASNIVCVNLAAVTVFRIRGITPHHWQERARSKAATRVALALWFLLLGALVALVLVAGDR